MSTTSEHYTIAGFELWRFALVPSDVKQPRWEKEVWLWNDGRWLQKRRLRLGTHIYCAAWYTKHK